MHIDAISLSGYRSIEPTRDMCLDGFGHINVFIGPNNCGKSSVFRFIQTLALITARENFKLASHLASDIVDSSWWWGQTPSHSIKALITFRGQPNCSLDKKLPGRFSDGSVWKVKIDLIPQKQGGCSLIIAPQLWLNDKWHDLISCQGKQFVHLNREGERVSSKASDSCPYDEAALELVKSWSACARFFDPVRALDRAGGRRTMIDGSGLLRSLLESQQDPRQARTFGVFRAELVARLNALIFVPVGMKPILSLDIKGTPDKNDLDIFLTHEDGGPVVSLQHMGTGIAELVILLATLIRERDEKNLYFLEEPETHLHPALVRRLLRSIQLIGGSQFFLSTHSNTLLDGLTSDDQVYHFSRRAGNGTEARRCGALIEFHSILDDLGVSGGSLLQANCVIWLEGPSDRVYVAKWLTTTAPDLIEGSDYVFSFYGGRILSHFAFEDQKALIALLKVNRFSVILMDRDISADQEDTDLRDTKARLRQEAKEDATHRLAILTDGREIENDLGDGVLGRALGAVVSTYADSWRDFDADGSATFSKQAAAKALPGAGEAETKKLARRIQQNKVDIARAAVADSKLATPAYVAKIVEFIRKSRSD